MQKELNVTITKWKNSVTFYVILLYIANYILNVAIWFTAIAT